tara:strand:+ start:434 stop:1102 length:669 start_codon:yes stop_codon:yes gene_type:complete
MIAALHLAVGTVAVVAGFMAMFAKKGTQIHNRAGTAFVISIVLLSLSGFYLSYARDLQFTFLLSAIALYLVLTGWMAAKYSPVKDGGTYVTFFDKAGLVFIALFVSGCFLVSYLGVRLGWAYPATEPAYEAYAFMGGIGLMFLVGDVNYVRAGRAAASIKLKRHLTRMCSTMLIATTIFFLGNNHVLPEFLRGTPILLIPILTVAAFTLIYRVGFERLGFKI